MSSPHPSAPLKRLAGKVAIITGGASGIGERAACLFFEHGAKVTIADVQDDPGQAICQRLGSNASYIRCDVTNENEVRMLIDITVEKHGKLDIMFNNAGIIDAVFGNILTAEKSAMEQVLRVNLVGGFLGAKHAARVMIPARKGCILFTASVAASIAGLSTHAYTASKHGIVGLAKNLSAELGQYGIRVNCISPFAVATNLSRGKTGMEVDPKFIAEMMSEVGNLKGVVLEVDDIAEAALFLASDEARYLSGLNLVVDGGFSVVNPTLSMAITRLSNL